MIVRPVHVTDLPALLALVRQAGPGLTTLPANEDRLAHRLRWAQRTFAEQVERADADYLFVLEDDDQQVVGVSALTGAVGLREPWYNYRVGLTVSSSPDLGIQRQQALDPVSDYQQTIGVTGQAQRPAAGVGQHFGDLAVEADGLTGFRITPYSRRPIMQGEATKSTDLNPIPRGQALGHLFKHSLDSQLHIL